MTTPTKEQIRTILGEIPRKYDYFWASVNLIPFIVFIITEWEKIVCQRRTRTMADMCGDNRFEVIEKVQKHLLRSTNLKEDSEEYKHSYSLLLRLWQLGYLK